MACMLHVNCVNTKYPVDPFPERFPVPKDKISWDAPYENYSPVELSVNNAKEGEPERNMDALSTEQRESFEWNRDGAIKRRSHVGDYLVCATSNRPLNPAGRTGVSGRGCLRRWGPNHAADAIVSRWKRTADGQQCLHVHSGRPILQFIAIKRHDNGQWAAPGGRLDYGEDFLDAVQREFCEEALNIIRPDLTDAAKDALADSARRLFQRAAVVYRGYADDRRNTDNAWMESFVVNYHDDVGNVVSTLPLCAGDDAVDIAWLDIAENELRPILYGSHLLFIEQVARLHNCHW